MGKYVGKIETTNGFYNFYPLYEASENGDLDLLRENDITRLLDGSQKPNVNLYFNQYDASFQIEKAIHIADLYLFEFVTEDLEPNYNSRTGEINLTKFKYSAKTAVNSGRLMPISKLGYYKVIKEEHLSGDFRNANNVIIDSPNYFENDEILVRLLINNSVRMYLGPYRVAKRSYDGKLFISPKITTSKYIGEGFRHEDCVKTQIDEAGYESYGNSEGWTYYRVRKSAKTVKVDLISDDTLLDGFLSSDASRNISSEDTSAEIIENYVSSVFVGALVTPEIAENRRKRLLELISAKEKLDDIVELINSALLKKINSNPDSEEVNSFLEKLLDSHPELFDKIQNLRIIREQISIAKQELEELQEEKQHVINETEDIRVDAIANAQKAKEETLNAEIRRKEQELDELSKKHEIVVEYGTIKQQVDNLKSDASYYEQHKTHLASETKSLEREFMEMLTRYSSKMANITFDGFISSKMLQAASEWENDERKTRFEKSINDVTNISCSEKNSSELLDYLVSRIQKVRPQYDKNMIINLMTCLSQSFLTVFSGLPGCGKTSACNLIGKVLGLNKIDSFVSIDDKEESFRRYVSVSVERGWTSKRDFIGYYNPLTKSFEESNRTVYNALKLLDVESRKGISRFPFFILLDEANLSPMEYYWADFMNVCDDLTDNNQVNIGNGYVFRIPETLHFCATINNDHTTETLSPRLIDRAWIISLPRPNHVSVANFLEDDEIDIVTWKSMKEVFVCNEHSELLFTPEVQKIYDAIKAELEKVEIYVSPRTDLAIRRYWTVASSIMEEDEYGSNASIIALDYAIAQKILPMINGSGESYHSWLTDMKLLLSRNNLRISEDILRSIIERGNRQMKYYQFFN